MSYNHHPSRVEIVVVVLSAAAAFAIITPILGQVGGTGAATRSGSNLRALHQMMSCYADDYGGRQFSAIPDDFGVLGGSCFGYADEYGCLPAVYLGWSCEGPVGLWRFQLPCEYLGGGGSCGNLQVAIPFDFGTQIGSFRLMNTRPLHDYLDGRFYDRTFYAPADVITWDAASVYFNQECEFASGGADYVPPSYVLSPAAMYDPRVLAPRSDGGFQNPDSFDDGYRSPHLDQTLYPNLKSWLIEHHWLDDPPLQCVVGLDDPLGSFSDCKPPLFNHGADSNPNTLFFDGSVDRVRTGDVAEADERLFQQTGDGLWSRDTPLGPDGYYGTFAQDDTRVSHHILTTGGIRGRDRIVNPNPGGRP